MAEWQSGYAADCKSADIGSIPVSASLARVAELVDARDLKSLAFRGVPVRLRPRAPHFFVFMILELKLHLLSFRAA